MGSAPTVRVLLLATCCLGLNGTLALASTFSGTSTSLSPTTSISPSTPISNFPSTASSNSTFTVNSTSPSNATSISSSTATSTSPTTATSTSTTISILSSETSFNSSESTSFNPSSITTTERVRRETSDTSPTTPISNFPSTASSNSTFTVNSISPTNAITPSTATSTSPTTASSITSSTATSTSTTISILSSETSFNSLESTSFNPSSTTTTEKIKRETSGKEEKSNGTIFWTFLNDTTIEFFWDPLNCHESYQVMVSCVRHLNCCPRNPNCETHEESTRDPHVTISSKPGIDYTVSVKAEKCNATWSKNETSVPANSEGIVCDDMDIHITPNKTFLSLNWTVPCSSYTGNPFTKIKVNNRSQSVNECSHHVVEELKPFTDYSVEFYDIKDERLCTENIKTKPAAPTRPRNLNVIKPTFMNDTREARLAIITWDKPDPVNGHLSQYNLTCHSNNSISDSVIIEATACEEKCSHVRELKPESNYSFSVTAENEQPHGEQSPPETIYLITESGKPFFTSKPLSNEEDKLTYYSITLLLNGSSISNDNGNVTRLEVLMMEDCEEPEYMYERRVFCILSPNSTTIPILIGQDENVPKPEYDCTTYLTHYLDEETCYTFYATIYTQGGHHEKSLLLRITTKQHPLVYFLIALIVVLALSAIVLIIVYIVYRKNYRPISYIRRRGTESIDLPMVVSSPPDINVERQILLSDLPATVENLFKDDSANLSKEYDDMRSLNTLKPSLIACLPINRNKNRYSNILPYDETRVVLKEYPNIYGSDYINASYIHGYSVSREFIACQGPKMDTVNDFWRMVWEKNVHVIVMVTQCNENSREKCCKYWPNVFKSYSFHDVPMLKVRTLEEKEHQEDGYILRTIKISKNHNSRSVQQFHFVSWPDMGCPRNVDQLINFVKTVKDKVPKQSSHVVVHCSAGVGRTGTFIGLSNLMEEMHEQDTIDVFHTVYRMRQHRINMVQTKSQYAFLYKCVLKHYLDLKGQSESWPAIESKLNKTVISDVINGALGRGQVADSVAVNTTSNTIPEEGSTTEEGFTSEEDE